MGQQVAMQDVRVRRPVVQLRGRGVRVPHPVVQRGVWMRRPVVRVLGVGRRAVCGEVVVVGRPRWGG
jgi:hypothetical protein